jgi:ABC-type cobalamin/Fe3+-siderophores transport system ATPase subunit
MKIKYFEINGYKNLRDKAIFDDIDMCQNYLALIGINGSGKSNVLESLARIFASMFNGTTLGFNYKIRYTLKNREIEIKNGELSSDGVIIKKKDIKQYLPDQVIACYSGEEDRLWVDIFESFYFDFFKKVLGKYPSARPEMLYLNKYSWNIALIALMCSSNQSVHDFLKNILNIEVNEDILIEFDFDVSKYPTYGKNNEVLNLINRINPIPREEKVAISINTLKSLDIGANDDEDFVKRMFFYLYIASMPKKGKQLKVDKIINNIQITFNGINIKSLSEGEKKLLLIKCIIDILGNENILFLFDEPDAHVHISRKKEIKEYLNKENHFSIFTTHSPTLLHLINEQNIRIVNNGDHGMEVIPAEKIASIEKLSGGAFTLMDATLAFATTKDILLVEGTNDYKYFGKAIEVLKRTRGAKYEELDIAIINCGGAGNVAAILSQIIIPYLNDFQLCIATFDDDQAGKDGIKGVKKIIHDTGTKNVQYMTHPRIAGWPAGNDFYTEDYFPIASYKPHFELKVQEASTFTSLSGLPKLKGIIENIYDRFDDADYSNFEVLLDKIVKLQTDFRNIAP